MLRQSLDYVKSTQMPKKFVLLKTSSQEKLDEIRPHFLKYNIECSLYSDTFENDPIAVLKEHSQLIKALDGTATVVSYLIVEQFQDSGITDRPIKELVVKQVYTSKAKGYVLDVVCYEDPKPWGYDASFIPDGIMLSYYELKKRGLKISPRDINIGYFLQDYVHYNTVNWTFKELKVSRPVDLEVDYKTILYDFFDFDTQRNFIGFDFWKNVVDVAVSGGLFIKAATTRKMNNYWWPVGNAGLPVTSKPNDHMQEKTYMMHDVFHFLVPDLLYTGTRCSEWSYTLHRVMTECFTLVLSDMFYVHYVTINGLEYKTVEQRRIYPIFKSIYKVRSDVFTWDIIQEVVEASCRYGIQSDYSGFIDLYVKYNGRQDLNLFQEQLDSFKYKYDFYLVQDLKWTINNAVFMRKQVNRYKDTNRYQYLKQLWTITRRLNIVTLDSLDEPEVAAFVSIGLHQLKTQLMDGSGHNITDAPVNKFLRWGIGQLCFFEVYRDIPFVAGYTTRFYQLFYKVAELPRPSSITYNQDAVVSRVRHFRYQWDYLMDKCFEIELLTSEEATQYKEVFPIFDPNYISSYTDRSEQLSDVMSSFIADKDFVKRLAS